MTVEYFFEVMARGFESKDVEYQQSESLRGTARGGQKALVSEADRAEAARRLTITLSLSRARADLAAATAPPHRRMLEQAIVALEAELVRP